MRLFLLLLFLPPLGAQLYGEEPEIQLRLKDYHRRAPYHTANTLLRQMKNGWPWLKLTAWPWVNEFVDLEGNPLNDGDSGVPIADRMNAYCDQLRAWNPPPSVDTSCMKSIKYGGCAFLHLLGAGLTQCSKDDCDCQAKKAAAMKANNWAANVVDSFGKIPSGIERGNFLWGGSWESCMGTRQHQGNGSSTLTTDTVFYYGQYCTVSMQTKETVASYAQDACTGGSPPVPNECRATGTAAHVNWGVCPPQTCSESDLFTLMGAAAKVMKLKLCDHSVSCPAPPQPAQYPLAIVFMILLCIFGVFLIFCTAFDELVYLPAVEHLPVRRVNAGNGDGPMAQAESEAESVPPTPSALPPPHVAMTKGEYYDQLGWYYKSMLCFSMTRNLGKIMNTDTGPGQMSIVHSVRVLSMAWVILGHTYVFSVPYEDNVAVMGEKPAEFGFSIVNNATLAVDSFFLLSGFLLAFLFLKKAAADSDELKRWQYWVMFYVHRILRLSPAYFAILACIAILWPLMGDGPFWQGYDHPYVRHCGSVSVLTNIFYLNNFLLLDKPCMGWSWYLANDMQFYVLSPPLLVLYHYYPGVGIGSSLALLILNFIVRAVFVVQGHYAITVAVGKDPTMYTDLANYFNDFYIKPYFRYAPFVIGIFLGWLYLRASKRSLRMPGWLRFCLWNVSFWSCFAVVFGIYDYVNLDHDDRMLYSDTAKALYSGLNRTVFSIGLSIILFLSLLRPAGRGGEETVVESYVEQVMNWGGWAPLSRLTYCTYLIHPVVIIAFYGNLKTPEHLSDYNMMYVFVSSAFTSYGLAMILSVAFESPFVGLEKLWLGPGNNSPRREDLNTTGIAPIRDRFDDVRLTLQQGLRKLGSRENNSEPPMSFAELAHAEQTQRHSAPPHHVPHVPLNPPPIPYLNLSTVTSLTSPDSILPGYPDK